MRSVRVRLSALAAAPRATWFLDAVQPSRDCSLPHDSAHENRVMITYMIATVILAVTYGALWQNQPARPPNDQSGDPGFRLGRLVNRALEWLVLMPHVPNPAEKKEPVFLTGKGVIPEGRTRFFRPVLRARLVRNPWRRILVDRAGMRPSIPAYLFKPTANTNELAAGKTT
jgi:hypothetical protein